VSGAAAVGAYGAAIASRSSLSSWASYGGGGAPDPRRSTKPACPRFGEIVQATLKATIAALSDIRLLCALRGSVITLVYGTALRPR